MGETSRDVTMPWVFECDDRMSLWIVKIWPCYACIAMMSDMNVFAMHCDDAWERGYFAIRNFPFQTQFHMQRVCTWVSVHRCHLEWEVESIWYALCMHGLNTLFDCQGWMLWVLSRSLSGCILLAEWSLIWQLLWDTELFEILWELLQDPVGCDCFLCSLSMHLADCCLLHVEYNSK